MTLHPTTPTWRWWRGGVVQPCSSLSTVSHRHPHTLTTRLAPTPFLVVSSLAIPLGLHWGAPLTSRRASWSPGLAWAIFPLPSSVVMSGVAATSFPPWCHHWGARATLALHLVICLATGMPLTQAVCFRLTLHQASPPTSDQRIILAGQLSALTTLRLCSFLICLTSSLPLPLT